jgi:Flp pilus assembly protein TadD
MRSSSSGLVRAEQLIGVGRLDEAAELLGAILAEEPENSGGWCLLARVHIGRHDYAAALSATDRAIALSPDAEWPHRLASIALSGMHRTAAGRRAARESVRLAPNAWQTHVQLASAAASHAKFLGRTFGSLRPGRGKALREARAAAARARQLAPNEADPWFVLGYTEQIAGRTRRSRAAYRQALALDPAHAMAHNNLAAHDIGGGALIRAAGALRSALGANPQSRTAQHNVEQLVLQSLFLGWLLMTVDVGIVVGLTYVASALVRALTGLAMLGVLGWGAAHVYRRIPPGLRLHAAHRLPRRLRTWALVPLCLAAVLVALVVPILPAPDARQLVQSYLSLVWFLLLVSFAARVVAVGVTRARTPPFRDGMIHRGGTAVVRFARRGTRR